MRQSEGFVMEILARTGRSQALPKAMLGPALSKLVEVRTVTNFFIFIFNLLEGEGKKRAKIFSKPQNTEYA